MIKILFPLLLLGSFTLIHYLAYKVGSRLLFEHPRSRQVARIILGFNLLCVLGYLLSRYFITTPPALYFIFSLSIGLGFILLVTLLLWLLFTPLLFLPLKPSRRLALKKSLGYASGLFLTGYSTASLIEGRLPPEVVKLSLKLPRLPQSFRAIQLSDLHIGGLIEEHYMEALGERINALKPDMIFLTGDITDASCEQIRTPLEKLKALQAPLGIYFVSGNHEFFHGIQKTMDFLREMGIVVLENDSRTIEGLVNIAGVHDLFGRRIGFLEPDLEQALYGIDPSLPTILLAHQPKFAKEALGYPVDLILSGHTHGGQIAPFGLLVRLDQTYLQGLYKLSPQTRLYVNPGTGFWGPPMRFLSRAEITLFEFTPS